jgi:phospholipase/lecithinase/hemolysin
VIKRALLIVVLWAVSLAGTAHWFYGAGKDSEIATQYREDAAATKAYTAAQRGAAEAISKLEMQRVEITQPVQRTVREIVRYRECVHDAGVLRNVNAALTGRAKPAGSGELPAASAPGR